MQAEMRQVKASIAAGFTDIIFGLFAYLTGFSDWYYYHFHMFGVVGFGMIAFGFWSLYFYKKEVKPWTTK